jgi:hypothetical protein
MHINDAINMVQGFHSLRVASFLWAPFSNSIGVLFGQSDWERGGWAFSVNIG